MSTFKAGTWSVDVRNVATGMRALNLHASDAEIAALLPSQAKFGFMAFGDSWVVQPSSVAERKRLFDEATQPAMPEPWRPTATLQATGSGVDGRRGIGAASRMRSWR